MPVKYCAVVAAIGVGCTSPCGPAQATVDRVIDGDTIVLSTGDHVRYLLIDSPEATNGHDDCFGANAAQFNADLVAGKVVDLTYDSACGDRYGRLLAFVSVDGIDVNALMVQRGYACVRYASRDGDSRYGEFKAYQIDAKRHRLGLWAACKPLPPAC